MYLDTGKPNGRQGIANCNTGVRICGRIDQYAVAVGSSALDGIDQFAFGVGLKKREGAAQLHGQQFQEVLISASVCAPIDPRFPRAEQVQIGAVQYQECS